MRSQIQWEKYVHNKFHTHVKVKFFCTESGRVCMKGALLGTGI